MANILIVEGDNSQIKAAIDQLGNGKHSLTIFSNRYLDYVEKLTQLIDLDMFDFILIGSLAETISGNDYGFRKEVEIFEKAFDLLERSVIDGIAFVGNPSNLEEKFSKRTLSLFAESYKFCFPDPSENEYFRPMSSSRQKSELKNSLIMFGHMIDEYKNLLTPEDNRLRISSLSLDQIGDLCYNKGHVPEMPWKEIVEALELPK